MHNEKLLFLDFETTSACDLGTHGLGRYLADPTTRPYCFTFRLPGMSSADLWEEGNAIPAPIVRHIEAGELFVAHNAPFDFHIWNGPLRRLYPVPEIRIERVRCSAARARYNGLPGSLENACRALGLPIQKDMEGSAVMKEVAMHPEWNALTHPDKFARIYKYALIDTDAMVGLWEATQPLPAREQRFFELDMRVNARGFGVDVDAAQAMEEMKALAEMQIDYQLTLLTNGGVLAASEIAKIKLHISQLGEGIDDAGKEALKTLCEKDGLPNEIRQILQLRLDASRAPKKSAAILRAHVDGRITHSTVYHGALSGRSTGRGAGGLQALNFARPRPGVSDEQCEAFLDAAVRRDAAFLSALGNGPMLAALADAQRSLIIAKPGHVLVDVDLSGIEARVAPWNADDEDKLSDFENGIDSYKKAAMTVWTDLVYEQVSKDQRQVGKVCDLSLGFGGGEGAFVNMAANYGVHLPPEQVTEIVFNWRAGRPKFERWWSMLEYAVLVALDQPGKPVDVPTGRGGCAVTTFLRDNVALRMILPSGRAISYHNARLHLEPGAHVPLAVYDKPEGYVETLDRKILSNNQTQGLARDYFWEIMADVDPVEPIVHHVYDQIVLEVPEDRAEMRLQQLIERMCMGTKWAPGLPLKAEGHFSLRWRKG